MTNVLSDIPSFFASPKAWLLLGGCGFLTLILFGFFIQRSLIPGPPPSSGINFFPQDAHSVMTNGDGELDNEPIYWLEGASRREALIARAPLIKRRGKLLGRVSVPHNARQFDVGSWRSWPDIALFAFVIDREEVSVEIDSPDSRDRKTESFRLPQDGFRSHLSLTYRTYSVATFSGQETDILELSCFREGERCQLRVLAGEFEFQRSIANFTLPFSHLDTTSWKVDFAKFSQLSLFLFHELRNGWVRLSILTKNGNFSSIEYQRDFELTRSNKSTEDALVGTIDSSPAAYFVLDAPASLERQVEVFPVPLPTGF